MRKIHLIFMSVLAMLFGWQTARADHSHDTRVEVWTAQGQYDAYDEDAGVEVFLRLHERGYVTVYQITPYGHLEVLYPQPHHYQRELRPNRIYRLYDLAEDIYLYDEEEGELQLGVIFTPEPVVVAPWLERSFIEAGLVFGRNKIIYAHVDFPRVFARVETEIRIHLGPRCRPAFVRTPVYVRPRFVYRHTHGDHGYRKSRPEYKKRDQDKRGYEPPYSRKSYEPVEPKRRNYEKKQADVRPVTFPSRSPVRKQDPAVKAPAQRSRREHSSSRVDAQTSRERKEASKQLESRDEEKRTPSARRIRSARADN